VKRPIQTIDFEAPLRIAVLRALYLGDMLCSVPALRALRRAAPDARITVIGLPWAEEFARRYPHYVDEFVEFPGFPGIPELDLDCGRIIRFLSLMNDQEFDLAIQMHGSGAHVNEFTALLGAKHMAGFYLPNGYCPEPQTFLRYPDKLHEIHRHLRLLERIGVETAGDGLEFPLLPSDFYDFEQLVAKRSIPARDYVCIHPGAKWTSRRWPVDKFATVGNELARRGLQIVLTGTPNEQVLVESLSAQLTMPHTNVCGKTSLGTLAAVLRQARLVITNDTGISHLTAAVGTRSIVIVLGSDWQRWAPLDRAIHRVVMARMDCQPCEFADCPIGFTCAEQIDSSDVTALALDMLEPAASLQKMSGSEPRIKSHLITSDGAI